MKPQSLATAIFFGILLAGGGLCPSLLAKTYTLHPTDDWFAILHGSQLAPGDEVVFQAGVYSHPRRLSLQHRGTAEQPIVIRGADGQQVIFQRPTPNENTFNLEGVQYLQLRNLEITGGSAAIRIGPAGDRQASDVLLEGLHIHHIGGVAVTCNTPGGNYRRMVFRGNHIHHTSGHGEAFYLGGNDGSAIFQDSLVENNYIHHLLGPQVSQGDGIEIKQGSFGNRIRGNIIHDTGYPGVIVYGTAGQPPNVVEQNVIWKTGDHGIQAAADAILRGNFLAQTAGAGIHCRDHQQAVTGNLLIRDNLIVASESYAIRIERPADDYSGKIEIIDNRLVPQAEIAVRAGASSQLMFSRNRGRGQLDGFSAPERDWQPLTSLEVALPELPGHPAWQHLQPSTVAKQFVWP